MRISRYIAWIMRKKATAKNFPKDKASNIPYTYIYIHTYIYMYIYIYIDIYIYIYIEPLCSILSFNIQEKHDYVIPDTRGNVVSADCAALTCMVHLL
jgi:hypothetical protein